MRLTNCKFSITYIKNYVMLKNRKLVNNLLQCIGEHFYYTSLGRNRNGVSY